MLEQVVRRSELLFSEILNTLSQMAEKRHVTGSINGNMKRSKRQISDLEVMLRKEKAEFEVTVNLSVFYLSNLTT